ncbi:MAG: signal peptidase I [Propionibacteriaceae bacterium]|nr:signal peptidase I [Propionibacteriaceae bacterium]
MTDQYEFDYEITPAKRASRAMDEDADEQMLEEAFDAFYGGHDDYFEAPEVPVDDAPGTAPKTQLPSGRRRLIAVFVTIAAIAVAVGLALSFLCGFTRNVGSDMASTVKAGDLVMFNRLNKNYQVSDLVVVRYQGEMQVRRVVATAGDTVNITDKGLVVNGSLQPEPNALGTTQRHLPGISMPLTVGPGQVFVLGDARDSATDSRVYGPVNSKDTLGRVIVVIKWGDL